jgi:hypothetical protein
MNNQSMLSISGEVREERERQDKKWGEQNHAPIIWIGILTEEVGEAAKAGNEIHFHKSHQGELYKGWLKNYREELIQVAAVATAAVESLDRNELKHKEDEGHAKEQTAKY